jgi:hypothetical protein
MVYVVGFQKLIELAGGELIMHVSQHTSKQAAKVIVKDLAISVLIDITFFRATPTAEVNHNHRVLASSATTNRQKIERSEDLSD